MAKTKAPGIPRRKAPAIDRGGEAPGAKSKAKALFDSIGTLMAKQQRSWTDADHAEFDKLCEEGDGAEGNPPPPGHSPPPARGPTQNQISYQ